MSNPINRWLDEEDVYDLMDEIPLPESPAAGSMEDDDEDGWSRADILRSKGLRDKDQPRKRLRQDKRKYRDEDRHNV